MEPVSSFYCLHYWTTTEEIPEYFIQACIHIRISWRLPKLFALSIKLQRIQAASMEGIQGKLN